jgi:hypothetical protein
MKPAGFDNAQGIITAAYLMDATDKQWDANEEMKAWRAWMDKNMPGANKADANHIYGYAVAFLMTETLKRCGDDLTRANLMKQAASFQKFRVPLILPGITVIPARPTSTRFKRSSCSASRAKAGNCSARSCTPRAADWRPIAPNQNWGRPP